MKNNTILTFTIFMLTFASCTNARAANNTIKPVPVPQASQKAPDKPTPTASQKPIDPKSIDISTLQGVLQRLKIQTSNLTSLQADIQYLFVQDPEMLDSKTLQKGKFFYKKFKDRSKIRIDFTTRKQDDEKQQKQLEQVTFDGVWLARIDHQLKTAKFDQQTEKDKPVEAFEFISRTFPMVGFTKTESLKINYHMQLVKQNPKDKKKPIQINLIPKKDSIYAKDFKSLSFWIDKNIFLPNRILTNSIDGDVYDIKLLKPRVNKNIKNEVFNVEPPANFVQNRRLLSEK